MMGLDERQAQEKFGFLLDAFAYGAPPHGGIAFGWDRICALLSGTDSIRDVIAFPKTGGGYDPLTEAPAPITPEQRREAGVDAKPKEASGEREEVVVLRTHRAGTLRADQAGETVTLTGWVASRRDHGGVAFLDLRDASGVVQVVLRDDESAHSLRNEWCVQVTGTVRLRLEGRVNPNLATGEVEVVADQVEVLSEAAALPFQIDEHTEVGEEARLKYRYLDLRRPAPAAAIRLRSEVNRAAREVLTARDFVEIETPTLTRSTPEGARDFLVPARLQPGSWYALPQSPQLFKQLLMVAGMERYFQIARCYRDEDFRADRQPEFTQLDIEMSFVEQDDVIALAEEVLARAVGADRLPGAGRDPALHLRRGDAPLRLATSPTCASTSSWSSAPTTSPTPRSGCSRRPTSVRW